MRRLMAGGCTVALACSLLAIACTRTPDASVVDRTLKAQILLDEHYGDSSRLAEASRLLDEVLNEEPDYAPAHVQAARLVVMRGHLVNLQFTGGTLERATQILLKAKTLDPTLPETHSILGHVYTLAGNYSAAEAALTEATRLGSTNPWTDVNRGHLYRKQGRDAEAQMRWLHVIDLGRRGTPQDRAAYIAAIEFQRHLFALSGQPAPVKKLGDLATKAALPHDAWTWGNYSNDLAIAGDFDEAIVKARVALTKMDYGAGRFTLACALIGKWADLSIAGKRAEAERHFEEAASVYPALGELPESFCGDSPRHEAAKKLLVKRLGNP